MLKNPILFKTLLFIIPVFNEEKNVNSIIKAIENVFKEINNCNYEVLFVDDGSTDNTLLEIKKIVQKKHHIFYLSLSKNFGKDKALMAGFQQIHRNIDAVITIDADHQHPPELIPKLIEYWQNGYDIVYTYRDEIDKNSSFFSNLTSRFFYYIISKLAEVELENGLSDYKLIDQKIFNLIKNFKEDFLFFRGLFKWVGFKQIGIPYKPDVRLNGESKYSTTSLIKLALNSIISFSTKPLTLAIYVGFFTSFISILYIPYVLFSVYKGFAISGWSSTIATIAFFGGIQLIVLGIIGIYLGKIFIQTKNRPQYIINESNLSDDNLCI